MLPLVLLRMECVWRNCPKIPNLIMNYFVSRSVLFLCGKKVKHILAFWLYDHLLVSLLLVNFGIYTSTIKSGWRSSPLKYRHHFYLRGVLLVGIKTFGLDQQPGLWDFTVVFTSFVISINIIFSNFWFSHL